MPRTPDREPIPVTYDLYEAERDNALHRSTLRRGPLYIVRIMRVPEYQTGEHYADDFECKIIYGGHHTERPFSLVEWVYSPEFDTDDSFEAFMNEKGILFDDPLPDDLEDIPFLQEIGYFVAKVAGVEGIEVKEVAEEDLVLPVEHELVLTR